MSNEFNLDKLVEGMDKDEAWEYIQTMLNPRTREQFVANKRGTNQERLRRQYDQEIAELKTGHLDTYGRIRKIRAVKNKYIDMGLDIG